MERRLQQQGLALCEAAVDQDLMCLACGGLLNAVHNHTICCMQPGLPLGQELVWEVAVEQHLHRACFVWPSTAELQYPASWTAKTHQSAAPPCCASASGRPAQQRRPDQQTQRRTAASSCTHAPGHVPCEANRGPSRRAKHPGHYSEGAAPEGDPGNVHGDEDASRIGTKGMHAV